MRDSFRGLSPGAGVKSRRPVKIPCARLTRAHFFRALSGVEVVGAVGRVALPRVLRALAGGGALVRTAAV